MGGILALLIQEQGLPAMLFNPCDSSQPSCGFLSSFIGSRSIRVEGDRANILQQISVL